MSVHQEGHHHRGAPEEPLHEGHDKEGRNAEVQEQTKDHQAEGEGHLEVRQDLVLPRVNWPRR